MKNDIKSITMKIITDTHLALQLFASNTRLFLVNDMESPPLKRCTMF